MTRRWIGYYNRPEAEIDMEQYVRDHPEEDPEREVEEDRAERMHEAWLDRIGGSL